MELIVLVPDSPIGSAYQRLNDKDVPLLTARFHRLRAVSEIRENIRYLLNFIPDVFRISKIVREYKVDIVQLNGLSNPHGAVAAKLAGKKVIWQLIDTRSPRMLMYLIMPLVVCLSDVVMATGEKTALSHPFIRFVSRKLFTFYPPVDLDLFSWDQSVRYQAREKLGIEDNEPVIGTVGTINPQKGHDCFIDGAVRLLEIFPRAKFLILGNTLATQKEYYAKLLGLAERYGLDTSKTLQFVDPGDRVHFWEQALDVYWMTSVPRSEGIPTAVEEAMALGIPVIATDVGSVSEIVSPGQTGYLVPPFDSKTLAKTTESLLNDRQLLNDMSKAARQRAFASFAEQACAKAHHDCYRFAFGGGGDRK